MMSNLPQADRDAESVGSTQDSRTVAVILNWRRKELTAGCVRSLSACLPERNIIIVDNGSGDGSVDYVRGLFPEAHILELPSNRGYAGGNNAGIRRALSMGAEFVFVLNNDVCVEPGCLRKLHKALRVRPSAGFACPVLLEGDPPRAVPPRELDWRRYFTVKGRHVPTAVTRIDYAPGAAVLMGRQVFERVGFFDEGLYLYCEDVDLSLRAGAVGCEAVCVPQARARHSGQATSGPKSPVHLYYGFRNMLVMISRYAHRRQRLRLYTYKLLEAASAIRHSLSSVGARTNAGRWTSAAAVACAFVDFILIRRGKAPEWVTRTLR